MSRQIEDEISQQLNENSVVLYMKGNRHMPQCGFSAAAIAILNEVGVPFKDIDVLTDPEIREGIKRHAQWPTIPQLYVAGEFVGGCDIMRSMHERGELAQLIKKAVQAA